MRMREIIDAVREGLGMLVETGLLDFNPRTKAEETIHWHHLVFNKQTAQMGTAKGVVDTPFYYVDLETGEEIGGFVFEPTNTNSVSIHIELHPAYQRRGYGTIIYDFAEHLAEKNGKRLVPASYGTDNHTRGYESIWTTAVLDDSRGASH